MFEILSVFFQKKGIHSLAPLPLEHCRILRPYLLERAGIGNTGTAVLFAVPYLTPALQTEKRNLSAYAVSPDYHRFFKELFEELLPALSSAFPNARFAAFADHSPIDEVHAAACAGLGVIGQNGLLITPLHSSFVFLGEIITDAVLPAEPHEILTCRACGACQRACPSKNTHPCLSALTQKKGTLTQEEEALLRSLGSVWGCDRCQEACPHTREAIKNGTVYTEIPYFTENTISYLTQEALDNMTPDEFAHRAYAWRGKSVIERNLALFESTKKGEPPC